MNLPDTLVASIYTYLSQRKNEPQAGVLYDQLAAVMQRHQEEQRAANLARYAHGEARHGR